MMSYSDPEMRDRLAAEYALGTLSGLTRRRFERLLSGDRSLRGLVEDWEQRLGPLVELVPDVEPPAHVWDEIASQIGREGAAPSLANNPPVQPIADRSRPAFAAAQKETNSPAEPWLSKVWGSLAVWRGAAALAAATAAALLCFVALRPSVEPDKVAALDERLARIESATRGFAGATGQMAALDDRMAGLARRIDGLASSEPTHVAVLLDKTQRPMMTADFDNGDGRLVLRLNITPPRDFTAAALEVWMVAPDGTRRSLGLFPSERPGTMTALYLPRDTAEALAKASLAVSLEPKGGSTTGQPSGPVLFTGPLIPTL